MEYSGQKRSNLLIAGAIWFFSSVWMLIKAVPHQIPLKHTPVKDVYHYTLCFFIFVFSFIIVALISADKKLLSAYAGYAVLLLAVVMLKDMELERELLDKVRNYVVAFFLLPYWGWMRIFKENTMQWLTAWFALSGAVSFFGTRLRNTKHE